MKKMLFWVFCMGFLFSSGLLQAQSPENIYPVDQEVALSPEDEAQALAVFDDLVAVMEQTTEIATKTRLNADFVPGMVTLLRGDDLEAWGVHTLGQALGSNGG